MGTMPEEGGKKAKALCKAKKSNHGAAAPGTTPEKAKIRETLATRE